MTVQPHSPESARQARLEEFPEDVIKIVNKLLEVKTFDLDGIAVESSEVIAALMELGYSREQISAEHMLNFAGIYRAMGWHVQTYDFVNSSYGRIRWNFKKKKA